MDSIKVNDDLIYAVTAGVIEDNKWRCWAWFASLEEAQRAVENCGDFFFDNFYEVLVIEEVPRGSITTLYREWWYAWNNDMWCPIPKPEQIETLSHFGIG